jgi:hypothetical protein
VKLTAARAVAHSWRTMAGRDETRSIIVVLIRPLGIPADQREANPKALRTKGTGRGRSTCGGP